MKIRRYFAAILAALILSDSLPVFAANPGQIPEETITERGTESEAPAFHARIEYRMGYTVIGTFTDFTPDITLIETLTSLDGENWQNGRVTWNLFGLDTDDEDKLEALQNQSCLFSNYEPLKSYIAGKIDRFYLKLRITKKNGLSYETQPAVIERGGLQPIPEGTERVARFSSALLVREPDPSSRYRYRQYGRYHLTISEDTAAEEISSFLPDTLPVEVQLHHGADFIAIGVVDCPVTWKPLSLPRLSAGESITIADAAEKILVPDDTLLSTPLGIFSLDEPLSLDVSPSTDEVRLVLNVCPVSGGPAGVLKEGWNGLEMAFNHYPAAASSIQTYILTEGESEWTELSGLSLLEDLYQPSTENSGYALILRNDQEPYRSYLLAAASGETPTPFFVGLEIKGGIYDGRQLILAWPHIYEELPDLPKFGGAEGNEGNAGADNKNDSTESGQRPNLPQMPEDNAAEHPTTTLTDPDVNPKEPPTALTPVTERIPEEQPTAAAPAIEHIPEEPTITAPATGIIPEEQTAATVPASVSTPEEQTAVTAPATVTIPEEQTAATAPATFSTPEEQTAATAPASDYNPKEQPTALPPVTEHTYVSEHQSALQENHAITGQRPDLPQTAPDISAVLQEDNPMSSFTAKQTEENKGRIPLLPVATAVAAGGCIGAAVCKAKGYRMFCRIAGKIRKMLHK